MNVFLAVIDDLYQFAVGSLLRKVAPVKSKQTTEEEVPIYESENIEELIHETDVKETSSSFKQVGDVFVAHEATDAEIGGKNTVMYAGTSEVPLYMNPTQEFDTILKKFPYGTMVMVLLQRGRWAKVVSGELTGWVLREDLADRAVHVYPRFVIGEKNLTDDPNTHRIRAMLGDVFGGAAAELSLQAGEYVIYRLLRKGYAIDWPETRPRVPGLWHSILKGIPGIHIGIAPKAGSIMEYMQTEETGHVAYVEAVFPDETINISEVNYPDDGIYNERVLTREEWRELKPIFIEVTRGV